MERAEWLKQMRSRAEALYDQFSPRYWVTWGLTADEAHQQYLQKFLKRVIPGGAILSAACGAGRYDGLLLDAGHPVVGIDQSAGVLARAREHLPQVRYEKMALQEMPFREAFDGIICMDAMEHIPPEDYPGILCGFQEALKPDGVLYFTADREEEPDFDLEMYFEQGKASGLPIVFGEVADEAAFEQAMAQTDASDELTDRAVYHYYPPLEKVRQRIAQAGLAIEEEGAGNGFHHFLARKNLQRLAWPCSANRHRTVYDLDIHLCIGHPQTK
jgi:2-polyprenyl-3-methyl-5-hydroxy-6-metoxy-1,4-benzoquinol methylase